ncbi:DUF4394 domain-containing protein [Tuwongella immobilis]|uniref:Calx-beta domain-containing protein n=1 Tax=Tuwongella immobilis TaxID=692036 RepID=A0A6C2YT15_9BACT|nr:DUF4394 domain-containing protein [Tuwongella immobilis]VIP04534.1 gll1766 protein : Uncharacterized protein OS=Tolypothrix bouteillei VB521301 GN=DA73_000000134810 PE=4 SV=1: DUF4394: DUF4394: Calx-beta: VCBS [Tuwongella immobilis]VTS06429.1 gll1766 protein : Uncharacterized protein OS=Tolypothrix bouteillei VB521301 GN=DA73_000000134810 PE=4 SV=1: DUF4394: DUF4394: Calx-beta: VCBS [Tuwongella immobilis]
MSQKRTAHLRVDSLEERTTPAVAYGLIGGATPQLVAFDTSRPDLALAPQNIVGVTAGEQLVGMDFRPQNGQLYALGVNGGTSTASVYLLSPQTGVATVVGLGGFPVPNLPDPTVAGVRYGVDFNPFVDRLRVTTNQDSSGTGPGLNLRLNPNTGSLVQVDTAINPTPIQIDNVAYTNSSPNAPATTLYTISSEQDSLYIQNGANDGTQTLPIPLSMDVLAVHGFDIDADVVTLVSNDPVASGVAFSILTTATGTGLATVRLTDGTVTMLGQFPAGLTGFVDLAIQSEQPAIAPLGTPMIAIAPNGTTLLRFNSANPGTVTTVDLLGLGTDTLEAIDFRPATGQLYGLALDDPGTSIFLYLIDPQTGSTTQVGPGIVLASGGAATAFGFDFNPTVDRIRVVTNAGDNLRLNPNDGTLVGGAQDGDINPAPAVVAATAYTNSFSQPLGGMGLVTTQYTLDATANTLSIQTPPNNGTQVLSVPITLNGAPLDFDSVNGFDIPANVRAATSGSPVSSGFGFASLTVGGVAGLYSINLVTGEATSLGDIGAGTVFILGLAVAQTPVGSFSFATETANGTEGETLTLTIDRLGGSSGEASVMVTVVGQTADANDVTLSEMLVTFADGQTTATVSVLLNDDTDVEATETLQITLTSPTNGAVLGTINATTVEILDNELAILQFQNPTITGVEGNSVEVRLIRTNKLDTDVSVTLTATGTIDTLPQVVNFPAGVTEISILLTLPDNALVGANPMITLSLIDPSTGSILGAQSTALLTIQDNDQPLPGEPGADRVQVSGQLNGAVQGFRFNAAGELVVDGSAFVAFPGFSGVVRSVVADLNGDGIGDEIFGVGPGGVSLIRAIDGATGQDLAPIITAYEETFTGGVFLAAGDFNGDGLAEIVLSPDVGGGGRVIILGLENGQLVQRGNFFGIDDLEFRGGARVTVGDINGDLTPDLIVAAGFGGGPRVAVFNGLTVFQQSPTKITPDFFAFPGEDAITLRNGVFLTAGDFNGDGFDDLAFGGGPGGGPRVFVLSGQLIASGQVADAQAAPIANFFAFDSSLRGGVRLTTKQSTAFVDELIVASGENEAATLQIYRQATLQANPASPTPDQIVNPFASEVLANGVFVG